MNTLTYNSNSLGASVPSAGLWRRATGLYWTGWSQYAASMNNDVTLRPQFPLWSRSGNRAEQVEEARLEAPAPGVGQRLVDRAA